MKNDTFPSQKLVLFEEIFFKKLQDMPYSSLLTHKTKLRKLVSSSIKKALTKQASDHIKQTECLEALKTENVKEKKYFSEELHNGLTQILSSLNFYVAAVKHPQNKTPLLRAQYLDKITDLSLDALQLSKNISNSLLFNSFDKESFIISVKKLCENISENSKNQIKVTFDSNFNSSYLTKVQMHQIHKISQDILMHLVNSCKVSKIVIKYSYKYNMNILQIDIILKDFSLNRLNLESQNIAGYNNLKHSLDLLNARFYLKEKKSSIVIKIPLKNKEV